MPAFSLGDPTSEDSRTMPRLRRNSICMFIFCAMFVYGTNGDDAEILSSLPLQIMVYFNWYFAYFFFVVNILLFIYKGYKFYYPPSALGWEVAMIFFLAIVDLCRLFLVSKGNKTEQIGPLVWSLGLTVPIIVAYSYYIDLQTYVLRVDLILNAMGLTFTSLEFFASVMAAMTFYSSFRG